MYVPALVNLPDSVAVPLLLVVNVIPLTLPLRVMVATGKPVLLKVKLKA